MNFNKDQTTKFAIRPRIVIESIVFVIGYNTQNIVAALNTKEEQLNNDCQRYQLSLKEHLAMLLLGKCQSDKKKNEHPLLSQ